MKYTFEAYKIGQLIKRQGTQFVFKRQEKNEFGELDGMFASIVLDGVYHEQSSRITIEESEATRYVSKPIPSILTTWELYSKDPILLDDNLTFNNVNYRVIGVTNIQKGNFGADISLEVVG